MEQKKYLQLNDIEAYKIAFSLSNYVWEITKNWDHFAKSTIGGQFIRAVDSMSANIAEGFGRYGKKDKVCFYRYCYGSIKESLDWNEKAKARRLISQKQYEHIFDTLNVLPLKVNYLIKFTNQKLTI